MARKQFSHRTKRPSIKDVAERAGVSTATVSNVYSGKKHVNADLAGRVRTAAKALGYTLDPVASQLRSGRARVVAVLVPDLEDLFLNRLVAKLETCAQEAGYEMIVSSSGNSREREQARMRALLAWRPAGAIIVPCGDTIDPDLLDDIEDTPIVGADRIHPSATPFDTVTIDNFGSGCTTTEHLCARGARSILLVISDADPHPITERLRGVQHVADRRGNIAVETLAIGIDPEAGANLLSKRLSEGPRPDAVVGLTNVTTLAALSAFAKIGMEVPRDTMLVGFHDSLWMTARKNPITTLVQPVDEVARCAWERLTVRMNGEATTQHNIVLSSTLVERASTMNHCTTAQEPKS